MAEDGGAGDDRVTLLDNNKQPLAEGKRIFHMLTNPLLYYINIHKTYCYACIAEAISFAARIVVIACMYLLFIVIAEMLKLMVTRYSHDIIYHHDNDYTD